MRIISEPYKINAEKYFKAIMLQWLGTWWWAIALPIAIQAFLAFSNIAFLYTSFMTLFLIYPPIVMFLYYQHALSPLSRTNTLSKRAIISDDGIDIIYHHEDENTNAPLLKPEHITWDSVTGAEYTQQYFVLKLNGSKYQLFLIPYSSINPDDQQILASYLDQKFNHLL